MIGTYLGYIKNFIKGTFIKTLIIEQLIWGWGPTNMPKIKR
jgi:hypothetical protein